MLLAAVISCFGTVSTDVMSTPRMIYAGANDGLFPDILGRIHTKYATPHLSIICFTILLFLVSISGGFEQLAILASAAILLIYLLVVLATIKLRWKQEAVSEKSFKIPGGLVIPVLAVISIAWLLTSLSKWEVLSTVLFIIGISIIYFVTKRINSK